MIKKAFTVVVICVFALGVVGCSSTSTNSNSASGSSSSSKSSAASTTSESSSSAAASTTTTSNAGDVADYCDKMQELYNVLTECMDATHDAETTGDVAAARAAKKRSDDAYGEVLRYKAPPEAKDVDNKMRAAAASMNLLAAFYEDATIAKAEGDGTRHQDDMAEIKTVITDVNRDVGALGSALKELTAQYK